MDASLRGHSRRSDRRPVTSGLPPIADIPSTVPLRALSLIGALSYTPSSNRDSNLERIWFQVVPLALAGDGVLRDAQHSTMKQPVSGKCECIHLDLDFLTGRDEADVPIGEHRL